MGCPWQTKRGEAKKRGRKGLNIYHDIPVGFQIAGARKKKVQKQVIPWSADHEAESNSTEKKKTRVINERKGQCVHYV